MEKIKVRASVHTVVDIALMGGDLVPGASAERLLEGIRGHLSLQSAEEEGALNEVPVRLSVESEHVVLTVYGRIDRLHALDTVEEIKTTLSNIEGEGDPAHWAQAECYAHMLCQREELPGIEVQLTYLNLSDGSLAHFSRTETRRELARRFSELIGPCLAQAEHLYAHRSVLQREMQALTFPYPAYRAGQHELAGEIYRTIRDKKMLLAQAPTGTGKTMAALFPALKSIGEGYTDRIFYLTARSTTRTAALEALHRLPRSDLRAVSIQARDSVCAQGTPICRSGLCSRQTGYYDRLPDALEAAETRSGIFDAARIRDLADEFSLCPYELSLDLASECDIILCDYNYLFDPRVRLQRFASGGKQGQVLLIDEAHNLPDRARSMYSAVLSAKTLRAARKSIDKSHRKEPLYLALRALIQGMRAFSESGEIPRTETKLPGGLVPLCEEVLCALKNNPTADAEAAGALFSELSAFVYHASHWNENDVLLLDGGKTTQVFSLFCTDASAKTGPVLKRSRAAVLFSATLTPMPFYRELTGASPDSGCVYLLSPFPPCNLLVLHMPVSTRFRMREETLPAVAQAVLALVRSRRKGNFIAFFPSYAYLEKARECIECAMKEDELHLLVQQPGMAEEDRAEFLDAFRPDPQERMLALCVLGGIFSEGIDLPADRLCGAAIVGMGLPQVCPERDALKTRYDELYGSGYDYAYTYPGISKVMQAAGRIIRTPADRGALLLLDDRWGAQKYRALLPREWQVQRVYTSSDIELQCRQFFND